MNTRKLEKAVRIVSKKGFGVVFIALTVAGPALLETASAAVNKVIDIITEDEEEAPKAKDAEYFKHISPLDGLD